MTSRMRTIDDLQLAGARVLLRADLNVPLDHGGVAATTVAGGGETVAALRHMALTAQIDHVSTGGGATLELLEGRTLPGVQALIATDDASEPAGVAGSQDPDAAQEPKT
jgi:3-phosphoglycerate kinase